MFRILMLVGVLLYSSALMAAAAVVQNAGGDIRAAMGTAKPAAVAKGSLLENGMVITTGDNSFVVMKFEDGQMVALTSNTSFKIDQYHFEQAKPEKNNIVFSLLKGAMRAVTGLIGKNNPDGFKLRTSAATIGIRGTDFMAATGSLYLQVTQGMVTATTSAGTATFTAGQLGFVSSFSALPGALAAGQLPAGVAASFSQLGSMTLAGTGAATGGASSGASTGGAAAGAGSGAAGATAAAGLSSGAIIGIGAVAAGVAAAGGGTGNSTTTHH